MTPRWLDLLSIVNMAANFVLLSYLVVTSGPFWPALLSGVAATSILAMLLLSPPSSRSAKFTPAESPSLLISPQPSAFLKPAEASALADE